MKSAYQHPLGGAISLRNETSATGQKKRSGEHGAEFTEVSSAANETQWYLDVYVYMRIYILGYTVMKLEVFILQCAVLRGSAVPRSPLATGRTSRSRAIRRARRNRFGLTVERFSR